MKCLLRNRFLRGFTMAELMIASTIFGMVLLGISYSHYFGLTLYSITKSKLGASDDARKALNKLSEEVKTARIVEVGNGDALSFTNIEDPGAQIGNALHIFPTVNSNFFISYYLDGNDQKLKRTGTNGVTTVIASSLTNTMIFQAENFAGIVETNRRNNRVINVKMEFYQIQYPIVKVGPGEYYDYYRIQTKITRRSLE